MELRGKILKDLGERSGVSASGKSWKAKEYVLEFQDGFTRYMQFEVFGEEKINTLNICEGEQMIIYFDIDSREYKGRWYNTIRAWKVDRNIEEVPTQILESPILLPETDFVINPDGKLPF